LQEHQTSLTIGFSKEEMSVFENIVKKLIELGQDRYVAEELAAGDVKKKREADAFREIISKEEIEGARNILSIKETSETKDFFDLYKYHINNAISRIDINNYHPTEEGQARAAEHVLDGLLYYTSGQGWLAYDQKKGYFRSDMGEVILNYCLKVLARQRYDFRGHVDDIKEYLNFAKAAVTEPSMRHIKKILESHEELYLISNEFDKNPYLINCMGETYDLRTGQHGPSVPEHRHLKTTGFKPEEGIPYNFVKFLSEITLGDKDLSAWIMRWFGYCLTGDTRAAYFVNFHGGGRNGKGTLLHLMRQIMGGYGREIDEDIIIKEKNSNIKHAMADLYGIRSGFASDVSSGVLNIKALKTITGGDEVVGEKKYKDAFTFRPIVKLTFSSNPILRLPESSQAIKSRLRYIPFKAKFAGREDRGLEDRLLKEAPQILWHLIQEAKVYIVNANTCGFPPCKTIDSATENYIKSEDAIAQFLDECTTDSEHNTVLTSALYNKYTEWSAARKEKAMSSNLFGRKVSERDVDKIRTCHGWEYIGMKINE